VNCACGNSGSNVWSFVKVLPCFFDRLEEAFDIRGQFSRFSKDIMSLLYDEVYVVNILGA